MATRRSAREPVDLQRLLLDVSRLAASRRDLDGLLGELVVVLQKALRFDGLAVVLHDAARHEMVLRFAGGSALPAKEVVTHLEADAAGLAWLTQQPIFVPDVERETRFPEIIEVARSYGTRSFCVFPLTSPVRRLGALGFTSRETDAFHDVDPEFLQQLTDEVALAVDNALHQESAEEAERASGRSTTGSGFCSRSTTRSSRTSTPRRSSTTSRRVSGASWRTTSRPS